MGFQVWRASGIGVLLLFVRSSVADVVELADSRAENVRIQTIAGGTLFYSDAAGALHQAPVGELRSLTFTELPELTDADRLAGRDRHLEALQRLLAAYPKATTNAQRLWLRVRLAQEHNELGDYVEAAGHVAAVWVDDPSSAWLFLQPMCEVHEATFYAAGEAMEFLTRADRALESEPNLHQASANMRSRVEPVFNALQAENEQLRYRNGSTISGFFIRDLGTERATKDRPWLTAERREDSMPFAQPVIPDEARAAPLKPESPEAIEALLEAGSFAEAIQLCERLAKDTGNRDLAQFLFQYGQALDGGNRRMDAAVQYMRCAAHFGGTAYGPRSLIKTAIIYRELLNMHDVANRLLDVAASRARTIGEHELADEAIGQKN